MSVDVVREYLVLFDSISGKAIDVVREDFSFDYTKSPSSSLNVDAIFDDSTNVQSVMVGFDDDPEYDRCESLPRFAVFKDTDGDFLDGTSIIDVGPHCFTATTVVKLNARPGCKGETETSLFEP